jgi:hypothetical protein
VGPEDAVDSWGASATIQNMKEEARLLTVSQAYEAAYRFVAQYSSREQESVSLSLMVVAMEPVTEHFLPMTRRM